MPETPIEEVIDPRWTVLLVHEMLNAFVAEGGEFDRQHRRIDVSGIVPPMVELIAAARAAHVRVLYVKWTTLADGSTLDPEERGALATSQVGAAPSDVSTIDGTWGWQVLDAVEPEPGDWVLRKYRPDAFFATPVDAFLRWNRLRTIVVVGVGAEVGILPTLMTASNLGYRRVVVSDCVQSTDPVRLPDALRYLEDQAVTMPHDEIVELWRKAARRPLCEPR